MIDMIDGLTDMMQLLLRIESWMSLENLLGLWSQVFVFDLVNRFQNCMLPLDVILSGTLLPMLQSTRLAEEIAFFRWIIHVGEHRDNKAECAENDTNTHLRIQIQPSFDFIGMDGVLWWFKEFLTRLTDEVSDISKSCSHDDYCTIRNDIINLLTKLSSDMMRYEPYKMIKMMKWTNQKW